MTGKVLHILWSGCIGGATRAVYQLVRSQIEFSRYKPVLAFAQATGYYAEQARLLGCEVIDLNLPTDMHIARSVSIRNIFESYPIHHFHSAEITMMLASIMCERAIRVYTHRGGIINYQGKRKLRYKLTALFLKRYFHALSGNTQHAGSCGKIVFKTNGHIWHTTYNGIDFSMLKPKRPSQEVEQELRISADGRVIIGTSAQLRDWKRTDLLIRACALLRPQSFYLLIIGDGPARNRLERLAQELGIASQTIFTGMKESVGDYLALMDVFVLPSVGLESFGNAAVEAMSQAIPVIVFQDGGGLLEHVQDDINGYVVSSLEQLSQKLQLLIDDSSLRSQMGKHAQNFVTSRYTPISMVQAYDDLYDLASSRKDN